MPRQSKNKVRGQDTTEATAPSRRTQAARTVVIECGGSDAPPRSPEEQKVEKPALVIECGKVEPSLGGTTCLPPALQQIKDLLAHPPLDKTPSELEEMVAKLAISFRHEVPRTSVKQITLHILDGPNAGQKFSIPVTGVTRITAGGISLEMVIVEEAATAQQYGTSPPQAEVVAGPKPSGRTKPAQLRTQAGVAETLIDLRDNDDTKYAVTPGEAKKHIKDIITHIDLPSTQEESWETVVDVLSEASKDAVALLQPPAATSESTTDPASPLVQALMSAMPSEYTRLQVLEATARTARDEAVQRLLQA